MQKFSFEELDMKGAYIINPFVSEDNRGEFIKDYSKELFEKNGIDYILKEVFYTVSKKGVIRAMHFQRTFEQPKLVRCIYGKIFDVIIDLRPNSETFKMWKGFYLTGENHIELLIPAGFGHGYLVLEDSVVAYKCAEKFYAEYDDGIMWNDPDMNIQWPVEELDCQLILSEKDEKLQSLKKYLSEYFGIY